SVGRGELAAEDGDLLSIRLRVVERHRVLALNEDRAGDGVRTLAHLTLRSRRSATFFSIRRARVSGLFVVVTCSACQLLFEELSFSKVAFAAGSASSAACSSGGTSTSRGAVSSSRSTSASSPPFTLASARFSALPPI